MIRKKDNEFALTNYVCHYGNLINASLLFLLISWLIIYPALYHKNLFWPFIVLYERRNFFAFLGELLMIGLFAYSVAQFFIVPFKIIFSEEGIRIFSLHTKGTYFIRWEDLTEFRFINLVRRRYQIETKYMRLVFASNKFSTKILGSLGPTFELGDFKNDNAANVEKILKLYEKKCPQLANSASLQRE
jgi:hypothetical protein